MYFGNLSAICFIDKKKWDVGNILNGIDLRLLTRKYGKLISQLLKKHASLVVSGKQGEQYFCQVLDILTILKYK